MTIKGWQSKIGWMVVLAGICGIRAQMGPTVAGRHSGRGSGAVAIYLSSNAADYIAPHLVVKQLLPHLTKKYCGGLPISV